MLRQGELGHLSGHALHGRAEQRQENRRPRNRVHRVHFFVEPQHNDGLFPLRPKVLVRLVHVVLVIDNGGEKHEN